MPQEDSKLVKKEEVEDEEDEKSIASTFVNRKKKSPSSSNATLKSEPKVKKEVKKLKKEETDEDLENPSSKNSSNKPDNKGGVKKTKKEEVEIEMEKKKKKKGGKAGDADKDTKKRERKVFDLPGQKKDPPEERDPLRIFYETLYKQVPTSEMASIWMMESGLLSKDEAKKVFEKKTETGTATKAQYPNKNCCGQEESRIGYNCEEISHIPRFSTEKKDVLFESCNEAVKETQEQGQLVGR